MKPTNWQLFLFAYTSSSRYRIYADRVQIISKIRQYIRTEKRSLFVRGLVAGAIGFATPIALVVYAVVTPGVTADQLTIAALAISAGLMIASAWWVIAYYGAYFEDFPEDFPASLRGRNRNL